ncbi:hypothetical protein [Mycolicibacterium fortuitum]|uniref:VG15 protein n=1 Tax=Mycolicibacterium fortuitum TaxID=1766 RepID=UPI00096F985C|nr:hypothetical protein [Mycolicibacterium fortuitum]OMC09230.1 hypothetical protein A5734_01700 [Mycolicibacterium fortuitum]
MTAPVAAYQAATEELAAGTVRRVLAIYAAHRAGQVVVDAAAELIAEVINRANAAATSLADVFLSRQIEEAAGVPTPTVGIVPTDEVERLTGAVSTILDVPEPAEGEPDQREMRLERMARSEPLETAQAAAVNAMEHQPLVAGWVRQMDAEPCELCRWWWRDGYVWPKTKKFQSHPGCNCQPRVVLAEQGPVQEEPLPSSEFITFTIVKDDRYE